MRRAGQSKVPTRVRHICVETLAQLNITTGAFSALEYR
jgi:hypothetical protein